MVMVITTKMMISKAVWDYSLKKKPNVKTIPLLKLMMALSERRKRESERDRETKGGGRKGREGVDNERELPAEEQQTDESKK